MDTPPGPTLRTADCDPNWTNFIELYARQGVDDFMIEVMLANLLAPQTPEFAGRFREELLGKFETPRINEVNFSPAEEQLEAVIATRCRAVFTSLLAKVAEREGQIRAARSKTPPPRQD
jgi:hypothetical protein